LSTGPSTPGTRPGLRLAGGHLDHEALSTKIRGTRPSVTTFDAVRPDERGSVW
jgi:hypothetical protein